MEYHSGQQPQTQLLDAVDASTALTAKLGPLVFYLRAKYLLYLLIILSLFSGCDFSQLQEAVEGFTEQSSFDPINVQYPETFRDSTLVDQYFGYQVADPYRWLEQDTATLVRQWESAQGQTTEAYLQQVPFRKKIGERLATLGQYYRRGIPSYHGGYYYLVYNDGQQARDALVRVEALTDSVTIVLDPNTWSAGADYELGRYAFSPDGRYLAYELRHLHSEKSQVRIVDVSERTAFPDELSVQGLTTLSWYEDGFFYTTFPKGPANAPQLFHRLYYHRLGTEQEADELVFADYGQPEGRITAYTDTSSKCLVLEVQGSGTGNDVYFRPLSSSDPSFIPITENSQYRFRWAGGTATHLHFVTDYQADKGRLIKVSTQQPARAYWEVVIGESPDMLQEAELLGSHWIAHYLRDGTSHVVLYDPSKAVSRRLHLPEPGILSGFAAGKGQSEVFFGFTSFLRPQTVYRLDLDNYRSALLYAPHPSFDPDAYLLQKRWIDGYDSTPIPVFLLSRKDVSFELPHLSLLMVAGSLHEPLVPRWNLSGHLLIPAILEQGGVVAIANIRGSDGFGRRWRSSGSLTHKQQSLDDLQAVAEYLQTQPFVDQSKLAVYGAGAGATLVGASINQRPDLFAVTIAESGWHDLLRYHRFSGSVAALPFYGSSLDSVQNDHLLSYSPLHNVLPNKFPASLLMNEPVKATGLPLHSRKLAAELQYQQKGKEPVLWYSPAIEERGGSTPAHANGTAALSFLFYQTQTAWE